MRDADDNDNLTFDIVNGGEEKVPRLPLPCCRPCPPYTGTGPRRPRIPGQGGRVRRRRRHKSSGDEEGTRGEEDIVLTTRPAAVAVGRGPLPGIRGGGLIVPVTVVEGVARAESDPPKHGRLRGIRLVGVHRRGEEVVAGIRLDRVEVVGEGRVVRGRR